MFVKSFQKTVALSEATSLPGDVSQTDDQVRIVDDVVYWGMKISENVIYLCYYKTKSLRSKHVRVFLPRHQTCTF